MNDLSVLIANLTCPQNKTAYGAFQELAELSQRSNQVYPYFDLFRAMADSANSYARSRGLALMAQNARWDTQGKMAQALDAYLTHIQDEKPITARQCVQNLAHILSAQPALAPRIRAALAAADFSQYPDSMSPLLKRDALEILGQLVQLEQGSSGDAPGGGR